MRGKNTFCQKRKDKNTYKLVTPISLIYLLKRVTLIFHLFLAKLQN